MKSKWSVVAAGCVAIVAIAWLAHAWLSRRSVEGASSDAAPPPSLEAWCASDLEPIEGGGCFAAPEQKNAATTLIVYLHGLYSPATAVEELDRQARVAKLATAKGFAVLALRGEQGECKTPELKDYFCWPSNERTAGDAPAFASRWSVAIDGARRRVGPGSNVLLGFSNGGYFAALVVKRALARFDAVVIAHAGPVEVDSVRRDPVPMLLITADDDASDAEMMRLDGELTRRSWPHALVAREGGHALPDWDIESALTFFVRAAKERWPLSPPLVTRSPRPRIVDSGVAASEADDEAELEGGAQLEGD